MRFAEIIPGLLAGKSFTRPGLSINPKFAFSVHIDKDGQLAYDDGDAGDFPVDKKDLEAEDWSEVDVRERFGIKKAVELLLEGKKVERGAAPAVKVWHSANGDALFKAGASFSVEDVLAEDFVLAEERGKK